MIDDLYYLEGTPPYARLKLPPMPSAVLILNLGDPFVIGGSGAQPVEFADGCFMATDLQLTAGHLWGRYADELCDRLSAAPARVEMLTLFEEELRRRLVDMPGLGLVQHVRGKIAAASGAVSIGGLCADAGVSTTHLAQQFKQWSSTPSRDLRRRRTWRCGGGSLPIIPVTPSMPGRFRPIDFLQALAPAPAPESGTSRPKEML